jgi:hypothetical protein
MFNAAGKDGVFSRLCLHGVAAAVEACLAHGLEAVTADVLLVVAFALMAMAIGAVVGTVFFRSLRSERAEEESDRRAAG